MANFSSVFQSIELAVRGLMPLSPADLQIRPHLEAAIEWVETAHAACNDGGVSKGYDLLRGEWAPSYPETIGYTIPTLLNAARLLERPTLETLAINLAEYLLKGATPEGAVVHWLNKSQPVVFDTGQVLFGWLAAYQATRDKNFLQSAIRAADWLVAIQDPSGVWKQYQHLGVEKVIDTRVAWALLELNRHANKNTYLNAARLNLEWAIQQQELDGWYNRCSFTPDEDPFTHTIAYTAEGLFECGMLLDEVGFIQAARLTADALLTLQHPDGRLASTFRRNWVASSNSSCLTGDCQASILWLRLFESTQERKYLEAARKTITFVARTQDLKSKYANIRGAIAGSYPITGRYERLKFPNWAAKFFIDALLRLERLNSAAASPCYVG